MSYLARSREKCYVVRFHGVESDENISGKTGITDYIEVITENGLKWRQ